MCGIVGYVGHRQAVPILLDGLKRLEYRGYDSAGVVVRNGKLRALRAEGKLDRLVSRLAESDGLSGQLGLGHTRWATHGVPSERNAHPVLDSQGRIALIHNGIIENFLECKKRLMAEGWEFTTDTDTEVAANLISSHYNGSLREAVWKSVDELKGMFAFAVIDHLSEEPEIVGYRQGPPMVLGRGEGEQYLASDPSALLDHTREVTFLENGDLVHLTAQRVRVWDRDREPIERKVSRLNWDPIQVEKAGFKHFMLKEIHEQPQAIQDTFAGRVDFERLEVGFETFEFTQEQLGGIERLHLLACGTSWHAATIGKFMLQELVHVPVEVDYGSEYRYRDPIVGPNVLALGISQSGETADTISAMEAAKEKGATLAAICNVVDSQAARMSDGVIYTQAGPEIGVASTKAFTTQLVALYLLGLYLRQQRGLEVHREHFEALAHLPKAVLEALKLEASLEAMARTYSRADNFLYLGRGINYPIALEGALKLKEISYIHAEGYPAGEMKHGPIALIDEDLPVLAIATGSRVFDKAKVNIQEVKARGGVVLALTDRKAEELESLADEVILVPRVSEMLQPIVNVVPLQLFAYFVGVRRGADVDQPRNLAKSVTVE